MERLIENAENRSHLIGGGIKEERMRLLKGGYKKPFIESLSIENKCLGDCSDMASNPPNCSCSNQSGQCNN